MDATGINQKLKMQAAKKPHPGRRMRSRPLLTAETAVPALKQAFVMLRPDIQWKNPVMFVVEVGAILTLLFIVRGLIGGSDSQVPVSYFISLDAWLFVTVLFANFATALAEARGKAQAESLRRTRRDTPANRRRADGSVEQVSSTDLRSGDRVVVEAGQTIPGDGEIVEGIASIDESAITGESAPVIREAGGDRSGVIGGTMVISDRIVALISGNPGESFLDKMIGLVEGAIRQRTPNEIALTLVLSAFTLIFLIVVIPLYPMAMNAEQYMMGYLGLSHVIKSLGTDVPTLVALIVCLIPTTIGALLAAIGIAGMERALQNNIIAKSGRAVETAGDVDVVLLDKTGTITMGNRRATEFLSVGNYPPDELVKLSAIASAADETPEGKVDCQILRGAGPGNGRCAAGFPLCGLFSADADERGRSAGRTLNPEGAADAIIAYIESGKGIVPPELRLLVDRVSSKGATPLVVADGMQVAGVIVLSDILKPGMKARFDNLRKMGLRTVMITGDNPLTAATIAAQAGVDDFVAQATPEAKLAYIRKEQADGKLVAMMGDGTNDAPALAQADVALAMNAGTQAAKEAANMVDLDSDPTKLIEVVEIGKQLLMTRGSLTTFSIANDVAKYFAIIPALFASTLPWLRAVDVMHLHSSTSAILSAIIFNALIIPMLIPIALKGVAYRSLGADALLRQNLLVWGFGGVVLPFIGIKLIDVIMTALHLVN